MKIELKSGDDIEFEEFELKGDNLRQVIVDIDGDLGETLWAWFSDEDIKKHDDGENSGTAIVVLGEAPAMFFPYDLSLAFIPVQFKGDYFSHCNFSNLLGQPQFHSIVEQSDADRT